MSRILFYAGAALLTYMFWWSGLTKLADLQGTQIEMAHFGLKPPWLFAFGTIAVQLAGSALVIFGGRLAWLGAAALGLFTLATIPISHDFWNLQGQAAFVEKLWAQEHVSMVGGLALVSVLAAMMSRSKLKEAAQR
jgi:uncharacterized membrane protein YphA (DoxX/SURF4 family)